MNDSLESAVDKIKARFSGGVVKYEDTLYEIWVTPKEAEALLMAAEYYRRQ